MAIIEEVSSDEEHAVPPNKPARYARRVSEPAEFKPPVSTSRNPVEALLFSRSNINQDALLQIVNSQGTEQTWIDILATTCTLLVDKSCDNLDINRIEGLVSIVALFAKHADSKEVAQAGDAEEKLERSLKIMYDILKIPPVFMKEDYAISSEDAQKQSFWLAGSTSVLQLLHGLFKLDGVLAFIVLELNREARTVISLSKYTTAPLSSNTSDEQYLDPWTTPLSNKLALEMLSQLASQHSEGSDVSASQHRIKLSKHILLSYIKPLFTTTPHPLLNPETGRKLDRRRGGDLFGDSYIDGDWKGQSLHAEETGAVGCWKTYLYVLSMIEKDKFEEIWPLLVPPMMTLLDDHQTYFKHQGILAVSIFLSRTPGILLQRTGLNDLIQQSLTMAFSFTSESANVSMIRDAITTNLQLVNLLYPKSTNKAPGTVTTGKFHQSKKHVDPPALVRFNTLSSIYHSCVINIFTYASSSIPFMTLAFESIPLLLEELGKGSIQFLQDSLTVLCSSLGGSPASKALSSIFTCETVKMHVAAAKAIIAFIEVCRDAGRIERWRGMIISSVATLWCNMKEQDMSVSTVELEAVLKQVIRTLADICGEVAINDCRRVVALDPSLFSELFAFET